MDAGRKRKKKTMNNTRRFSEEQIRSLESMFGNETRLEPRKKVELARELGLQPRQVAIWFQNKRARWKSKQLEREYGVLRANYNTLASRFGDLKEETQALLLQLEKLKHVMHKSQVEEGDSDNGNKNNLELEEILSSSLSKERSEQETMRLSDEDMSFKAEYLGVQVEEEEEEAKLVGLVELGQSSLQDWGNLELNQYISSYQLWDLWS